MTVILVLLTFLVFILVDWLLSRKKAPLVETAAEPRFEPAVDASFVDGFLVPDGFRYHPGHSWALHERKHRVRVGVDEFAAALMGRIERIELPKLGVWIRQGQKAMHFFRDGENAEMLSPAEGEVIEINQEVLRDPSLVRKDPYGQGWMMLVDVPDEETTNRNLVPETLVGGWMRAAVGRLYALQPKLAGAVAADGGRPAQDLSAALPDASWKSLTQEFFLTK